MKANMPRSWYSLPKAERESLQKVMTNMVYDKVDEEQANLQEVWIKLACIVLHDVFGMGETRLLRFVAAWKRIYRKNERTGCEEKQTEWLASEMARCFPKGGFPQERIDELKDK